MHGNGAHAVRLELADDTIGSALGAAEHEGLPVVLDQLGRDGHPIGPLHLPEMVGDVALRLRRGLDGHPDRVPLVAADDGLDLAPDGGREEEHLAIRGGLVQEAAHRREEPHVGHAVRLVEDDRGHVVETHVTPLDEVFEAAGAGDHDVDPLVQGAHLVAVAEAAEDRDDPLAVGAEQVAQDVVHLRGQLPGRHEDQRPRAAWARLYGVGGQGDPEGQRLARPGGRLATDVTARQRGRDRRCLDGERLGDPEAGEAFADRRGDAKV